MEKKRKTYLPEYMENQEVREPFKRVIALPVIDTDFINDVFEKIKDEVHNLPNIIKDFLQYFETQFLEHYSIEYWPYFKQYSLRTNNCRESYNNMLNSYFVKKPTFWKLLHKLRQEIFTIEKNYNDTIDIEDPIIKKNINLVLLKLN